MTDEAKKILKYEDGNSTGNFIPLNYREHILPWLQDNVLNNCAYKDQKMIAGILQYIDHLEGIFNIRKDKKKMNEELIENIRKNFNITGSTLDDFQRIAKCKEIISLFSTELENLRIQMVKKNPWNQLADEKAVWLAQKLWEILKNSQKGIKPFESVWIYQEKTTVLEGLKYKDYSFAIDISCGNLSGMGISIIPRGRYSTQECKNICEQCLEHFFKKHNWEYKNNWRYMKSYNDISNDKELKKLIDSIFDFIEDLNNLS